MSGAAGMGPAALNINDALPEEALCLILGAVDFASKAAVLRTCKKWYKLLTYPPQGSGVWGTLPLNLMRLHIRVNNAELDWLARRAAGVAGVSIYANSHDHAPRFGAAGQPLGGQAGGADSLARQAAMPYRLAPGRHFADFSLARILGMLSPWLQPASVSVNLRGATFEHRSFGILTSESQPWLTSALVDVQFQSNMMKAEDRFAQLCAFTNLTRLECLSEPGAYSRTPCLQTVPTSTGSLTQLRVLKLDLHADSAGLPPAASALQALRTLELRAGPKFDPDVLASLSRLEDLSLSLGKRAPPGPPAHIDEERLAQALAPLTRLTRLQLTNCCLGAVPPEVLGMRALADLDLSSNQLWRCGGPPPPPAAPDEQHAADVAAGDHMGPNPFPFMAPHFIANWQQQQQQNEQQQNAQQPNAQQQLNAQPADGGAAAAQPAGEPAQPGGNGGEGQAANAQGANAQAGGAPGQPDIYQMLQEAHAAAADEARLMAAHARQGASLAKAAAAGHGWWPAGLADALHGLTRLSLGRCSIKALPVELSRLDALRELHLPHNMLGGDERATAVPALPKLLALDVAFNGYNVLPPGLLMLSAITRLRFCDIPQQPLPPLEPLLQMPNLQQVTLLMNAIAHRNLGNPANIMWAGAFEAKFVALRQARAEAQLAPSGDTVPMSQVSVGRSAFMQLGAVEEPHMARDAAGYMYEHPNDYLLPGHLLPPGHPGHPHLHVFDPIDDEGDEDDDHDEDDDEDEMEWAEDAGWADGGPAGPDFGGWQPGMPPPIF